MGQRQRSFRGFNYSRALIIESDARRIPNSSRRRTNCIPRITRSARNYGPERERQVGGQCLITQRADFLMTPLLPARVLASMMRPTMTRAFSTLRGSILPVCVYTCRHRRKGTRPPPRANEDQHYRTRGYRGLHDACVGRVEGSLFPLACACRGTWVSCPPYSATRSRVTPRLFLRRISALDRGEDRRERCGVEKGCGKYALNFGFERKRSEDRFIRFMEIVIPLSFSRNFNNNKTFFFPRRRGGRECFFVKRRFLNKYRRGRRSADVGASSCFDIRVRD